jgi:hypothetical protein
MLQSTTTTPRSSLFLISFSWLKTARWSNSLRHSGNHRVNSTALNAVDRVRKVVNLEYVRDVQLSVTAQIVNRFRNERNVVYHQPVVSTLTYWIVIHAIHGKTNKVTGHIYLQSRLFMTRRVQKYLIAPLSVRPVRLVRSVLSVPFHLVRVSFTSNITFGFPLRGTAFLVFHNIYLIRAEYQQW